jgi:hypothetical protein
MFRGNRRRFANAHAIVCAALFFALGGAALGAGPVSVPLPSVKAMFSGRITPRQLPARSRAPVSLNLAETVETLDGSHPPALQELDLELDRHLGLSVEGVPVCQPHGGRQPREETISRCEDAKVGSGTLGVEVAFPEQTPIQIRGRVSVYNFGVRDGGTTFLLYTYLHAPVTGAIPAQLIIHRRVDGIYGWKGTLSMPKIANGAGSVTHLGIRFRKGIFSASCPTEKWQGRAPARFADGSVASSTFIQRCQSTS